MIIYCYKKKKKKLLSGSSTTFLYIFLYLFEMPGRPNSTEPCFLAPEVKLGSGPKEPGFLLSIRGSQPDNFPRPCTTTRRRSLAPWLREQSRFLHQRHPLFLTLLLKRRSISRSHFVCPSSHPLLPLNQLVCAISKATCRYLVAQVRAGLWQLTEVLCSSGTPEFDPQVWLQSVTSLNTPVSPQLRSLGRGGL